MTTKSTPQSSPPTSPPYYPPPDTTSRKDQKSPGLTEESEEGAGVLALLRGLPPEAWRTRASLCRMLEEYLRRQGYPVRRSVPVGDTGTGKAGILPLVVQTTPPIGIAIDRQRPSPRSVLMLSRFPGRRVIILRTPVRVGLWHLSAAITVAAVPVPQNGKVSSTEPPVNAEAVLILLDQGCRHLGLRGVSPKSPLGVRIRRQIIHRLREGFTSQDLRQVLDWASARCRRGERYPGRNLLFLWGIQFPTHLADAESRGSRAPTFRTGEALEAFDQRAREASQRSLGLSPTC